MTRQQQLISRTHSALLAGALAAALAPWASAPAQAATINASNCSLGAVQSAIDNASTGDVVSVPSGSCSWGSSLRLSKAIHLEGAGAGSTRITVNSSINLNKSDSGSVELSGFTFRRSGGGNGFHMLRVGGSPSAEPPLIHDNVFTVNGAGIMLYASNGGVIYDNVFNGGWDDSGIQHYITGDPQSWSTADSMGTRDTSGKRNLYVEDNVFNGMTNQATDFGDASRVVFRHNELNNSSFNTHGLATSPIGVRHFEIYDNAFRYPDRNVNQNWLIWLRGGTGVIYSNQIDNIIGSMWGDKGEVGFSVRMADSGGVQGCARSYPAPHQVGQNHNGSSQFTNPVRFWNNTGAFRWELRSFNNSCGNRLSDYLKEGRDFVFAATSKPGYTAYPYPHPLRSGDGGGPPPSAPPGAGLLDAPQGVAALAQSTSSVRISWGSVTGASSYRLYRCATAGCLATTRIADPTGTQFTDTGLAAGRLYRYRLRTTNVDDKRGDWSATASVTTPTDPPTDLPLPGPGGVTATALSADSVRVSWNAVPNAASYRLYRCKGGSCTPTTRVADPTGTAYEDDGLDASANYRYRLRTTNTAGTRGSYSSTVTVSTLSEPTAGDNVYYADRTAGNDNNPGTRSRPWRNVPGMNGTASHTGSGSLSPGDTVYLDRDDTWVVSGGPQGFFLVGGVRYIGDEWEADGGSSGRARLRASNDFNDNGVVRFRDHATEETVFKGFEIDVNGKSANGIDINHGFWSLMNGAMKRVENVEVYDVFSESSRGEYKYGIAMSNFGGSQGILENVEILDCKVHDIGRDAIVLYPSDDPQSRIGNITVRGCEVYNTGQDPGYDEGHGIVIKGWVYDSVIENNYIHDVNSSAVFVSGPDDDGSQRSADIVTLRNNILTSQDNNGVIRLYKRGAKELKIHGNLIFDNTSTGGFNLGGNSGPLTLRVYNNTFHNAFVDLGNHSSNVGIFAFRNNIVQVSGTALRNAGAMTHFSNNLFSSGSVGMKAPNNRPTGFVGTYGVDMRPNTDGFSLTADSPAVDGGLPVSTRFANSINSTRRPQGVTWDVGAYERRADDLPVVNEPLPAPANLRIIN